MNGQLQGAVMRTRELEASLQALSAEHACLQLVSDEHCASVDMLNDALADATMVRLTTLSRPHEHSSFFPLHILTFVLNVANIL